MHQMDHFLLLDNVIFYFLMRKKYGILLALLVLFFKSAAKSVPLKKGFAMTPHVQGLIQFLHRSPSPYHAVESAVKMLLEQGFTLLDETSVWHLGASSTAAASTFTGAVQQLVPGGRYVMKRHGSSLVAFTVGRKYSAEFGAPFKIIAAHSDSPCLKVDFPLYTVSSSSPKRTLF
jgi:Aminopeptidase I zinc metalloprotease (M18)